MAWAIEDEDEIANNSELHLISSEKCSQWEQRGPIPGKLLAIQKWELPKTITSLRGFLGFANYYSGYEADFARLVIPLQGKLKVPKAEARNGSCLHV